ncbi:bifunctional 3-oxoadipate enol-lactonase/4-carboxymuconolactone decarboxylase PcaDC [Nocardioides sambongensis]|nr:4-carboxymuconolactone decarboxylase [Nocardioides sambongensis]
MTITTVHLGGEPGKPLLVLGPSLGTSVATLWGQVAARLDGDFHLVGWDLPGHGYNRSPVAGATTVAEIAADLLAALDRLDGDGSGEPPRFHYAGDSVGGAVGLQLLLDAPDRVRTATLCCSAAHFGGPEAWQERIATVTASGTPALISSSAERWFAPGFLDRQPDVGSALLHGLADADDAGYAAVCGAIGGFDVRERLGEIGTPVLTIAGAVDQATPPDRLALVAERVRRGRAVVLEDVAHLAPAEAPVEVARLLREHALSADPAADPAVGPAAPVDRGAATVSEVREAGMAVRREVLGDAHVDRATAAATPLTEEFQRFITEYAWGGVWTRPGLDRRSRSMITLTALIALGHHEELAMHLRAARRNGLSTDEIKEVLLQSAIYCGVPAANTAFRIAQQVLSETTD